MAGPWASLVMTGLMVVSSSATALFARGVRGFVIGQHEAIYSIGAWLIGVALVSWLQVGSMWHLVLYCSRSVFDLREDAFARSRLFLCQYWAPMPETLSFCADQWYQTRFRNVVMMAFQILSVSPFLFIGSFYLGGSHSSVTFGGDCPRCS